ncbi:MAG: DUF502 domain-containing protein [bacterium]
MTSNFFKNTFSTFWGRIITGLIVLLPLSLTLYLSYIVFMWLDSILGTLLNKYLEEHYIKGLGLLMLVLFIWFTGLLTRNLIGKRFVQLYESFLHRVPILGNIFGTFKKISDTLLSGEKKSFKQVVLVLLPGMDIYSIGFLTTGEVVKLKARGKTTDILHVLIPTTPNPTSGFIVLVKKNNVIPVDMTVEEGLKAVISLGVLHPKTYTQTKIPNSPARKVRGKKQ